MGGGNSKIKVDGIPPKERMNLKEKLAVDCILQVVLEGGATTSIVYSPKENAYFVTTNFYGDIYKIQLPILIPDDQNIQKIGRLKINTYNLYAFTRKNEIYYRMNDKLYLYDNNIFTEIANLGQDYSNMYPSMYDEKKDELILYSSNKKIRKYSFEKRTLTEITNKFPENDLAEKTIPILKDNKIYWIGSGTDRRGVKIFDLENLTIQDNPTILPYEIQTKYNNKHRTKAFLLKNKIHITGFEGGRYVGSIVFREKDNVTKWEKVYIYPEDVSYDTVWAKRNDGSIGLVDSNRNLGFELKYVYENVKTENMYLDKRRE